MSATSELLLLIKENNQDFEWYPTTKEIIAAVIGDIEKPPLGLDPDFQDRWWPDRNQSVLDVGAGDGRVLLAFGESAHVDKLYAMEKSPILASKLPASCNLIGTDFWEQSLYDKSQAILFCNPPYSQFSDWATRILRESASERIYLVIPRRWRDDRYIAATIKDRSIQWKSVGEFDFENADRQARCKVEVVRFEPKSSESAFDHFFDLEFEDLVKGYQQEQLLREADALKRGERRQEVVSRTDLISALVLLYGEDVERIRQSYLALCKVNVSVLKELDVQIEAIKKRLLGRLSALKGEYWSRVFDNLDRITHRLTYKNRETLKRNLFAHSSIDFTIGNVLAIVLWAIENSNRFLEEQFLDTYSKMVESANVINYVSNQRVFKNDRWRYNRTENSSSHFYLNFRIVCQHIGGIKVSEYSFQRQEFNGLEECAYRFMEDLITIANNIGFTCHESPRDVDPWVSNRKHEFSYIHPQAGRKPLYEARCFQNGNMHLRLANEFALALNVEWGRLRGWVKDGGEASREMSDMAAELSFGVLQPITIESLSYLLAPPKDETAEPDEETPVSERGGEIPSLIDQLWHLDKNGCCTITDGSHDYMSDGELAKTIREAIQTIRDQNDEEEDPLTCRHCGHPDGDGSGVCDECLKKYESE